MRRPGVEQQQKTAAFRAVLDRTKRVRICPWCGESNGNVKKTAGALKIVHDKYSKGPKEDFEERRAKFKEAMNANEELEPLLKHVVDLLDPLRVLELFRRIPDADLLLLDLGGRPENLLVTNVAVPPVCIRPSVEMDGGGGSNEDDVTVKMMHITQINRYIQSGLEGVLAKNVVEWWDGLQVECAMVVNSDLPGISLPVGLQGKRLRGFVQRLKGKQGRFRGNLSGKRVDFTGRTVISPDPNVRIDEVVVPRYMAMVLTYPERVTTHNMHKLRRAIINGTQTHPGARFVIGQDGRKSWLQYGDRRRVAAELRVGDVVERHLWDGDVVLFNRQPSLHRVSIMAFRARVMPGRTLRFNECCCAPFNADFDGDEMNIHVPQTEEARAEAVGLMGVLENLAVPKSGEVLVAATQDFLTCAFLLTRKDEFFTRADFCRLATFCGDGLDKIDLPPPTILKPIELWTGKQVFSVMLRPNTGVNLFITLETKEKSACACKQMKGPHNCPNDGHVYFRNSDLLCGRLGKATLGGGNKTGLFAVLANDYSPKASAACMARLAKCAARYMGDRGFSIGIDDVTPSTHLSSLKRATVASNYAKCDELIDLFHSGKLQLNPGCSLDQTLENEVMAVLNDVRNQAAESCMRELTPWNSPLIQSQCGSKGSPINICQMVACVGQQSISGKRSPNGFTERTLPHFPRGDKSPEGKGFVASSYYSGLSPTEFFFHTMAGREGLVDTAVKTAETGYMSRRLMKALEDLYVDYDGSVRSSSKAVIQFTYGDDGLDPVCMEASDGQPLDLNRVAARIRALDRPSQRQLLAAVPSTHVRSARVGSDERDLVDAVDVPVLPSALLAALEEAVQRHALRGPSDTTDNNNNNKNKNKNKSNTTTTTTTPTNVAGESLAQGQNYRYSDKFVHQVRGAVEREANELLKLRQRVGLPPDAKGDPELEHLVQNACGLNPERVFTFVDLCCRKFQAKRVDPGATVGAYGAQSIGEPGTQMTLKTFHFAGVAAMNVTLGVPRIKEIINASKVISTPIISVCLSNPYEELAARMVKGRIETTLLGGVCKHIQAVVTPVDCYVDIWLDRERLNLLQLGVNSAQVAQGIAASKLRVKMAQIQTVNEERLVVRPDDLSKDRSYQGKSLLAHLDDLRQGLPSVVVAGIPTISRAIMTQTQEDVALESPAPAEKTVVKKEIEGDQGDVGIAGGEGERGGGRGGTHPSTDTDRDQEKKKKKKKHKDHMDHRQSSVPDDHMGEATPTPRTTGKYMLLAEGTDLQSVMSTPGVVAEKTTSNHVMEVLTALGIEAARETIIREIQYTMGSHGMVIDYRHVMLLADCMTSRGEVLGITRFGIAKMKDSVLMLASFEKTTDHLFEAAIRRRTDEIEGVSECIIMGIPMPTGTGLFRVLHQDTAPRFPGRAVHLTGGGGEEGAEEVPGWGVAQGNGKGQGKGKEGFVRGWPRRRVPLFAA